MHELIAQRRSPRAFDPDAEVSQAEIAELLDAARWAPSSMNRQPWAFLVGFRGERAFKGIADCLAPGNQLWALNASALLVAMVDHGSEAERTDPGRAYELGLAMGQLGIQAVAMGLITHQMGGFDRDQLRREFALSQALHPLTVTAVGRPGDPELLPADLRRRETAERVRRPVGEIRLNIE